MRFLVDAQLPLALARWIDSREGHSADLGLSPEKPRHFFSRVGKGHYRHAVYIGPDDVASGHARLKDLTTREETDLPLEG